jgi:hypothetical protein
VTELTDAGENVPTKGDCRSVKLLQPIKTVGEVNTSSKLDSTGDWSVTPLLEALLATSNSTLSTTASGWRNAPNENTATPERKFSAFVVKVAMPVPEQREPLTSQAEHPRRSDERSTNVEATTHGVTRPSTRANENQRKINIHRCQLCLLFSPTIERLLRLTPPGLCKRRSTKSPLRVNST